MINDLRYAFRSLRRAKGFTAIALLTLALGIGANAAIFSVINAVLLKPLPFREPGQLVRLYESMKGQPQWQGSASVPNFRDWREQTRTLDQLASVTWGSRNLQAGGEPERVSATSVSANLFAMLGVRPIVGRAFQAGEDEAGRNQVVLLSEGLWRRRFGADPHVVGRAIVLDGMPHTIVGVLPADASRTMFGGELWVPYAPTPAEANARGSHFLTVVGRLKPGATPERAEAEMQQIAARLERQYPEEQANRTVRVLSLRETIVGGVRPALLILLGAVALVLLIACANVANLMLVRAVARTSEVAVRVALGASRQQLVRQYLTEGLLLALGGAVLGGLVAYWGLAALNTLGASALQLAGADASVALDARVFVFLLLVAAGCGVAFGLAPALQASPARLRDELAGSAHRTTADAARHRFRDALVVAQIALSLVLLVGAGLLMRAFLVVRGTPTGLVTENVLTAHVAIPEGRYTAAGKTPRLLRPILERARALPGVKSAAMISMLPIQSAWTNAPFVIEGEPAPEPGKEPGAEVRAVSPGYFETLGIPLKAGRMLTEDDGAPDAGGAARPRVLLVNDALARRHFKRGAVGRRIRIGGPDMYTIVGVVGDVRQAGLDVPPLAEVYFPYADSTIMGWLSDMTIVAKTAVPPAAMVAALRGAARAVAPDLPLYGVQTMDEVIARSLADRRFSLTLLGTFAVIALLLATSGLYGVISYLVAQRTREVGIRIALGAQRSDVLRLVMRQGAALTALGLAVGLAGAFGLTRLLASMLFGVGTRDPLTFAAVPVLLDVVAMLATLIPAWRAARVDPLVALRAS